MGKRAFYILQIFPKAANAVIKEFPKAANTYGNGFSKSAGNFTRLVKNYEPQRLSKTVL
jgi:hypothetical protein